MHVGCIQWSLACVAMAPSERMELLGPPGKFIFLKNWKIWQKSNKFQNVFLFCTI
jgi:hypothetical protein